MFKQLFSIPGFFVFFMVLIFSTNCSTTTDLRPAGLEPSWRPLQDKPYEVTGKASSRASNFILFWSLPVTDAPDLDRAINEAIAQHDGDELIDIRWYEKTSFWLVGTVHEIYVTGKVIRYDNSASVKKEE